MGWVSDVWSRNERHSLFQDGVDEPSQLLHGDPAEFILVGSLEENVDVGGGTEEGDELLLVESTVGIGVKFGVPLGRCFARDTIPLDAFELACEFFEIQGS